MKLLILVHRFPYPPTRGDALRAWGEIEHLAARHDVWLACVERAAPRPEHVARARELCREVAVVVRGPAACAVGGALRLLAGGSVTEGYFFDRRLAAVLARWDRKVDFDAVLTFSPAMAPYATLVRARRRVLDMNDVESARWRAFALRSQPPLRWLYALESRRLPPAEAVWMHAHDLTLLVNERERAKLPSAWRSRAAVVHTGVDLAQYGTCWNPETGPVLPDEPVLGIVGSMSYGPNIRGVEWFGRRVWPRVLQEIPAARWWIVGRRPARSVRRWGRQPGVTVTGFVEDVRPYLAALRVYVCPVREQIGVQTKLIEALGAARPAVVTPAVASGFQYDDPPPFAVASSAREFAQAVVRLLRDAAAARSLARRARAVAEREYDAREQLARVEKCLVGPLLTEPPRRELARSVLAPGCPVEALPT
jgi:polysaccharide biosynthesis protein PslH